MTSGLCNRELAAPADVGRSMARSHWLVLGSIGLASAVTAVAAFSSWADGIVLAVMIFAVRGTVRRLLALGTVVLFVAAFPPLFWPTFWFCLAPLVWIWRERRLARSLIRDVLEAVAVGFAMAWLSTGFVRDAVPAWGGVLQGAACLVFSLQVVGLALAIRFTRDWPVLMAATLSAVVAVAGELLNAGVGNGVVWSVTSLALAAADTPVAQWAAVIAPFGVSGILYLVNFLCVPNSSPTRWRRWTGPMIGVAIASGASSGGCLLASGTRIEPLPFSVMLVQPHVRFSAKTPWRPWTELDPLTRSSLQRTGQVDLIVWPEACLSHSQPIEPDAEVADVGTDLSLQSFSRTLQPLYQTNCLVGVPIWKSVLTERYGLQVTDIQGYNCGCLVSGPDVIACHEKRALVPLKEGLPGWLDHAWIRGRVLPALKWTASLTPGRDFRLLSFRDREQRERVIAVSICYESFLPWLPQYRNSAAVDAVIHLVYDGDFSEHPGLLQRQILACRYRAIETRTWNLVCSTWAGSAIIDPTGKIVGQLGAASGVLRSDLSSSSPR